VSTALVGVLIGGGLTLLGGLLGQAAAHAFAVRRDRESRLELRRTTLADVRLNALLDLQDAAATVYADAAMRPTISLEDDLREHQTRLLVGIAKLAVPRSRIDDRSTAELVGSFVAHAIDACAAYDDERHEDGDKLRSALKTELDNLIARTAGLLDAERAALGGVKARD
jgi:hypothetical protein